MASQVLGLDPTTLHTKFRSRGFQHAQSSTRSLLKLTFSVRFVRGGNFEDAYLVKAEGQAREIFWANKS